MAAPKKTTEKVKASAPPKKTAASPTKTENLPVSWDDELAKEAQVAAKMEAGAAGFQWFSIKGGILSWGGTPLPHNAMAVVIVDHVLERAFYEGDFDEDNPANPVCFAFGREPSELKPHENVVEDGSDQHDFCAGCGMDQWGTADKGKGKACKDLRRLAVIPAGTLNAKTGELESIFEDPTHYERAQMGGLKIPVTSVKAFATFVQSAAASLSRPPHGLIVKIRVEPHPKNQMQVIVEPLTKCPDVIMPAIVARRKEAQALIVSPYPKTEEPAAAKGAGKKESKRPPVKKKGRKY